MPITGKEIIAALGTNEFGESARREIEIATGTVVTKLRRLAGSGNDFLEVAFTGQHITEIVGDVEHTFERGGLSELPGAIGDAYRSARDRVIGALRQLMSMETLPSVRGAELLSQLGIREGHQTDMRLPTVQRCISLVLENIALRLTEIARSKKTSVPDVRLTEGDIRYIEERARQCAEVGHMLQLDGEKGDAIHTGLFEIFETLERLRKGLGTA